MAKHKHKYIVTVQNGEQIEGEGQNYFSKNGIGLFYINLPKIMEDIQEKLQSKADNVKSIEINLFWEEDSKQRPEKYSERFDNDKSAIGNPETWGKRMVEEPRQETISEASENWDFLSFEAGAKWQQERSYSEEEIIQLVSNWNWYRNYDGTKTRVKFREWFEQFKKK